MMIEKNDIARVPLPGRPFARVVEVSPDGEIVRVELMATGDRLTYAAEALRDQGTQRSFPW